MFQADEETQRVTQRFAQLVDAERSSATLRSTVRTLSFYLGERAEVGDASAYIFQYARSQGYMIPPYPMAGNGEFKEFLADQQVRNIPEWYLKLGVDEEQYQRLNQQTIVVVRTRHFHRVALFLDGVFYKQGKGFLPLSESGVADKLDDERLRGLLNSIFDVLMADDTAWEPVHGA